VEPLTLNISLAKVNKNRVFARNFITFRNVVVFVDFYLFARVLCKSLISDNFTICTKVIEKTIKLKVYYMFVGKFVDIN